MVFSRSTRRAISATILAASFCLAQSGITRAEDQAPPPKHVKTLQERILEIQSGVHDQDLKPTGPKTFNGPDRGRRIVQR